MTIIRPVAGSNNGNASTKPQAPNPKELLNSSIKTDNALE
jgi:hypothetical protein